MSVLDVEGVSKYFRKVVRRKFILLPEYRYIKAVDDVSFSVDNAEVVGLLGPNGAGKTTLTRTICGILYPDRGTVKICGIDPHKFRTKAVMNLGAVFGHKSQLYINLKASDAVRIISMYYGVPKDEFDERFFKYCKMLGVEDLAERRVRSLSLGERMKFELIAALIHDPELLILDEPTIGLDFASKEVVRDFICECGKSVLFTSHDALDIESVCNRVIIMNKGKIVFDTSIKELRKHIGYKYVEVTTERKIEEPPSGYVVVTPHILRGRVRGYNEIIKLIKNTEKYKILDVSVTYPSIEEILVRLYREGV